MKAKKQNKKFNFEKFEVAKLSNMKVIKGGSDSGVGGNDDDRTGTDKTLKMSTFICD
jgi:natural product precursor